MALRVTITAPQYRASRELVGIKETFAHLRNLYLRKCIFRGGKWKRVVVGLNAAANFRMFIPRASGTSGRNNRERKRRSNCDFLTTEKYDWIKDAKDIAPKLVPRSENFLIFAQLNYLFTNKKQDQESFKGKLPLL